VRQSSEALALFPLPHPAPPAYLELRQRKVPPTATVTMPPKVSKGKKGAESVGAKLQLVMKSGKYTLGYKTTLKTLRSGKAKLVLLSNNLPALRKSEIEYYAMMSRTGVHHFTGEGRMGGERGGGPAGCSDTLRSYPPRSRSELSSLSLRDRPERQNGAERAGIAGGRRRPGCHPCEFASGPLDRCPAERPKNEPCDDRGPPRGAETHRPLTRPSAGLLRLAAGN